MKRSVILVAGGTGSRMQHRLPKQFLELRGEPVLVHTLRLFHRFDPGMEIVVVMHQDYTTYWTDLCGMIGMDITHTVVAGGQERFHSVKAGLARLGPEAELIGVHDAVRPLAAQDTVGRCYDAASLHGAAIPVVPVQDSLRTVDDGRSKAQDRSRFRLVQTPQCFRREILLPAYEVPWNPSFTDDASVVEAAGHSIHLVEGNAENIKLTSPADLIVAEAFLSRPASSSSSR